MRDGGKAMLQTAIDKLLEGEDAFSKIEILNELTDQLADKDHVSNIRVKLMQEVQDIASEFDICPECGCDYVYCKGIKRCPCGRRSDNE